MITYKEFTLNEEGDNTPDWSIDLEPTNNAGYFAGYKSLSGLKRSANASKSFYNIAEMTVYYCVTSDGYYSGGFDY